MRGCKNDFVSRSNVKPSRRNTEITSTALSHSRSPDPRSPSPPHQHPSRPRRRRKPQSPKFRQHPLLKQPPWLQSLLKKIHIDRQSKKYFKIIINCTPFFDYFIRLWIYLILTQFFSYCCVREKRMPTYFLFICSYYC